MAWAGPRCSPTNHYWIYTGRKPEHGALCQCKEQAYGDPPLGFCPCGKVLDDHHFEMTRGAISYECARVRS